MFFYKQNSKICQNMVTLRYWNRELFFKSFFALGYLLFNVVFICFSSLTLILWHLFDIAEKVIDIKNIGCLLFLRTLRIFLWTKLPLRRASKVAFIIDSNIAFHIAIMIKRDNSACDLLPILSSLYNVSVKLGALWRFIPEWIGSWISVTES